MAHLASTSALPLKFRDSIYERDRINTGEKSVVKVLMGGKAVVTVRELSVLTITEDLGKTTVNLSSGKIAVAVAKQRMKPGESFEVHTPNAVAAVRGTVFVVEVEQQAGGQGGTNTQVTTVHGAVAVGLLGSLAGPALVNAFQQVDVTNRVGKVGDLTQHQMDLVLNGLGGAGPRGFNRDTITTLIAREQQKALAQTAPSSPLPLQGTPPGQQSLPLGGCGGAPCLKDLPTPPPPPPPPSGPNRRL